MIREGPLRSVTEVAGKNSLRRSLIKPSSLIQIAYDFEKAVPKIFLNFVEQFWRQVCQISY